MRLIASQVPGPIRIVGLCTSLANAKDLGEWIGASSHSLFNFPPGALPSWLPLAPFTIAFRPRSHLSDGLCSSLAVVKDLGEWIKPSTHFLLNCPPFFASV